MRMRVCMASGTNVNVWLDGWTQALAAAGVRAPEVCVLVYMSLHGVHMGGRHTRDTAAVGME